MIAKQFTGLILAAWVVLGSAQGLADDVTDLAAGIAANRAEDYKTAIHKLLPLAIEGNAEAQNAISWMYFDGHGFSQNGCASTIWAEKAARQGHPVAAAHFAFSYDSGIGVRKNREMAYRWMAYADKLGHPKAHEDLDFMARGLTLEERAAIDRDMKTWDPSKLPAPEFFIIDKSVEQNPDLYSLLHFELNVIECD